MIDYYCLCDEEKEMIISECCGERLTYYNKEWDDGICSKCNEHSPALREEEVE